MKKIKMFLISTFLSLMCLVNYAFVFAGNGQSGSQTTVNDICVRLSFIERKILFETTTQLLSELNLVFIFLKTIENKLSFDQKTLVLEQFKNILHKPEFSCRVKNSDFQDRELYDNLSCKINDVDFVKTPPAPKLKPKKFKGEIGDLFWLSSIGTEEITELKF